MFLKQFFCIESLKWFYTEIKFILVCFFLPPVLEWALDTTGLKISRIWNCGLKYISHSINIFEIKSKWFILTNVGCFNVCHMIDTIIFKWIFCIWSCTFLTTIPRLARDHHKRGWLQWDRGNSGYRKLSNGVFITLKTNISTL